MSSKDNDNKQSMNSKSTNTEIIINNNKHENINELFESLFTI